MCCFSPVRERRRCDAPITADAVAHTASSVATQVSRHGIAERSLCGRPGWLCTLACSLAELPHFIDINSVDKKGGFWASRVEIELW